MKKLIILSVFLFAIGQFSYATGHDFYKEVSTLCDLCDKPASKANKLSLNFKGFDAIRIVDLNCCKINLGPFCNENRETVLIKSKKMVETNPNDHFLKKKIRLSKNLLKSEFKRNETLIFDTVDFTFKVESTSGIIYKF